MLCVCVCERERFIFLHKNQQHFIYFFLPSKMGQESDTCMALALRLTHISPSLTAMSTWFNQNRPPEAKHSTEIFVD